MNKYIISVFLILICGSSFAETTVGFLIPSSGLGDQSFNDMTYAGLVQARNKYKFELIREVPSVNSEESRRISLEKLLQRGATVVVANGWDYRSLIPEYAQKKPQIKFLIQDVAIEAGENLASIVYGQHESSFLAGALAGWMTGTGRIGFIGGEDMPVIRAFLKGFEEGAVYGRKDVNLSVVFLSGAGDPKSGFDNPSLAYKKANLMYDNGVDIIFTVAGLSGNGVIRSAQEKGKFVIGVDADQDYMAKGYVLTSVMKRLDRTTYEELRSIMEGAFHPGIHRYGLKEGGVALSPMTYTREIIGIKIMTRLQELEKKLIDGEVRVTDLLKSNN